MHGSEAVYANLVEDVQYGSDKTYVERLDPKYNPAFQVPSISTLYCQISELNKFQYVSLLTTRLSSSSLKASLAHRIFSKLNLENLLTV